MILKENKDIIDIIDNFKKNNRISSWDELIKHPLGTKVGRVDREVGTTYYYCGVSPINENVIMLSASTSHSNMKALWKNKNGVIKNLFIVKSNLDDYIIQRLSVMHGLKDYVNLDGTILDLYKEELKNE